MKHLFKAATYKTVATLFLLSLIQVMAFAQDNSASTSQTSTTTTTTEDHTWYTQPWAWVVGGAILLLLIAALVRSNNSSSANSTTDKVTVTKTTETDTNP